MRSHTGGGDQAIECRANGDAGASSLSVKPSCQREVVKTLQPQDGKLAQVALHKCSLSFSTQPLEDLGEHDVGQTDRSSVFDELDASPGLRGVLVVEDGNPDTRVDDDQTLAALLASRSPSQRTLPRILRMSARR